MWSAVQPLLSVLRCEGGGKGESRVKRQRQVVHRGSVFSLGPATAWPWQAEWACKHGSASPAGPVSCSSNVFGLQAQCGC